MLLPCGERQRRGEIALSCVSVYVSRAKRGSGVARLETVGVAAAPPTVRRRCRGCNPPLCPSGSVARRAPLAGMATGYLSTENPPPLVRADAACGDTRSAGLRLEHGRRGNALGARPVSQAPTVQTGVRARGVAGGRHLSCVRESCLRAVDAHWHFETERYQTSPTVLKPDVEQPAGCVPSGDVIESPSCSGRHSPVPAPGVHWDGGLRKGAVVVSGYYVGMRSANRANVSGLSTRVERY